MDTGQKQAKGRGIAKPEIFARINFLYQAAHTVLRETPDNTSLVRFYAYNLRTIATKNVLRLDPSIKRTLCKKCSMLLIPGVTAIVRPRARRQRHLVVTCLECGVPKRFLTASPHSLWCEQEEAKHRPSQSASSNQIHQAKPHGNVVVTSNKGKKLTNVK